MLRIWPLYFLLVLVGTVAIPLFLQFIDYPYEFPYQFGEVIGYHVFIAPFMVNIIFGHHLLEPLWSIGVEEIFYIIWAPLFKFLKNNILTIILLRIFAFEYLTENFSIFELLYATPVFSKLLLTTSYAWLIVNISINRNTIIHMNQKSMEYLGDICDYPVTQTLPGGFITNRSDIFFLYFDYYTCPRSLTFFQSYF